jgi:autotransporter strand-loop-strand O-heptosyltransferase
MKITNVTPGLLPIPPNGWGAVEKIIWEIHNNLQKLGHQSDIKYLNDVNVDESDIVHIHVANLALDSHSRGIPYYFSMHDHHSFLYGKDSYVFKENYEAIKNSILTFLPAKYLVNYFGLPNAVYLPHGVNTSYFTSNNDKSYESHSILCVANNGYANNPTYDRKGFLPAIEAARKLGLPITLAGPTKNNLQFFQTHNVGYDKLTIKYDLSEEELKNEFTNHTIFLHLSELEAGHPNLTLLEAMASGLVVVGTLEDGVEIEGLCKVKRDVSDAVSKLKWVIENYDNVREKSINSINNFDWSYITKQLVNYYKFSRETIRHRFQTSYINSVIHPILPKPVTNKILYSFLDGPKVEILGSDDKTYSVKFIDLGKNEVVYQSTISNNQWAKVNKNYYVNWKIEVYTDGNLIDSHMFNCNGKHVFIKFESSAIGDTLAWVPYVDEFRKKHNCKVYCATFHNHLFEEVYTEIDFVSVSEAVNDVYEKYELGWFYDSSGNVDYSKHPNNFVNQPLQKTASDILGLDYVEIIPKIKSTKYTGKLPNRYFTFSMQSTAQSKYWNHPNGWKLLLDKLGKFGLVGICVDKHVSFGTAESMNVMPDNCIDKTGLSLEETMGIISGAEFHVGISSGLSWLAWALETPLVLISGFTDPIMEPVKNCVRIHNPKVCNGCFTNPTYKFDRGDWMWCPVHKGTDRQFECTKTITPEDVLHAMLNGGIFKE